MQTLLSTRLFASRPLGEDALLRAARAGFPSLEIFASPPHYDPLDAAQTEELVELLASLRLDATWVHLDVPVLAELGAGGPWERLTAALIALDVEMVTVPTRPWRQDGTPMPDLRDLLLRVEQAGARLCLDFSSAKERAMQHPPKGVDFCWDLAGQSAGEVGVGVAEGDAAIVEGVANLFHHGPLGGVRVAHLEGSHREPPTEREARLLEGLWPHLVPRTLVYDVEDPSDGDSPAELQRIFREIHSFHSGEKRPPGQRRGGVFWAAMAPG